MTTVLEIDTKKTLYEPLEILIDGKVFRIKSVTFGAAEKIQKLQNDAATGSPSAIRKMLEAFLEGPMELLSKLTFKQIIAVLGVIQKSVTPEAKEKNGRRPGPKK